jgi:hypothetical protein
MPFPISIIPSIVGAGASLIGGLVNNAWAESRTDKQFKQMNEMQDKMNAYNAPVAQMARLREAGLNPNLVYANGGAVMQSAVGNAPNPPNTAPIDTQGVLQMVQTIVGAMLEKDKIQANKDMQKEQIDSTQKLQTEKLESDAKLQTEKLEADSKLQEEQIKSREKIEDANLKENTRQFNETMKQRVNEFNARINLDKLISSYQIKKINSDIELNKIRSTIEQEQLNMARTMHSVQLDSALDSFKQQKLRNFLSVPYKLETKDVFLFVSEELGYVEFSKSGAEELAKMHNDIIERRMKDADLSTMPLSVYWDAVMGPVKDLVSVSK